MPKRRLWGMGLGLTLSLAFTQAALAQGSGGPTVSDTRVGYIDSAIPGSLFRLRYDNAANNRRPTRAEYFYPRGAPLGPGLPLPEPSTDYLDVSAYLEAGFSERFSGFVDLPVRFLNPEVNTNHAGLADINAGLKLALVYEECSILTVQFRTYVPSGDTSKGLGTDHVSLEPALLYWSRLSERTTLEAELRYWLPLGGTDFAGDIMRYGVGLSYELMRNDRWVVAPVVEFVGWTVINGQAAVVTPGLPPVVEDAKGDTILNVKAGLRINQCEAWDFYIGYGRPLTGDRWYENTLRIELRLLY